MWFPTIIPTLMNILNMVIPIIMHIIMFYLKSGVLQAACHPTKCDRQHN